MIENDDNPPFQTRLAAIHATCCNDCEFEGKNAEISAAALKISVASLPAGSCSDGRTRHQMQQRHKQLHLEHERISKQVAPQFIDPITGFILWELVSFVVGKVLEWLYRRWFGDAKFAADCQACAMAAGSGEI